MNRNTNHIDALTGVRGYAALWIVGCHMAITTPHLPASIYQFLRQGWIAVDFFFILSGFIISYVYSEHISKLSFSDEYRTFIQNRFFRIYPTVFFVLIGLWLPCFSLLKLAGYNLDPQISSLRGFLFQLFLLNGLGLPNSSGWNGPTWAISSEFFLYLFFPVFSLISIRLKKVNLSILSMLITILILITLSYLINEGKQFMLPESFRIVRVSSSFLLGCLIYNLFKTNRFHHLSNAISLISFFVIIVMSFFKFPLILNSIYIILFVLLVHALAHSDAPLVNKIFINKTAMFLGRLSFSIYVIHYFILSTLRSLYELAIKNTSIFTDIIFVIVFFMVLIPSAYIVYRYIEVYFYKKFRKSLST